MEAAALWLEPVYHHMHRGLIAGNYLQADETPVRCNDPDRDGKTAQCYLWVISRPASDVVFSFRETRCHDELPSQLGSFKGVLQADRYIEERPKAANLVLRMIARLYQLERVWDEAEVGDERAALRQKHFARPLRWLRYIVAGLSKRRCRNHSSGKRAPTC